ncbi:MAG: hypothetical protein U0797_26015 [Gemmataceae bacterium]
MKYFTPERYLRLQNPDDSSAWLAAHNEWDEAVRAYWAEVRALLERLPKKRWADGIRQFVKQGSLHDGTVTSCWYEGSQKLKLQVQPELPGERLVLLEYTLAQEPTVLRNQLPGEYIGEGRVEWMYDELGPVPGTQGGEFGFLHAILLSNGWELTIPFTRLRISRCQSILPAGQPESARLGRSLLQPA